ncbi:MAG: AlpA family phage regulatory protein [Pseudomonas sp.]|uniref:helix-turn-helix transcriptional regulator n=1 Tax=Pseudomonas sp. TaxID=306 RepID=UPI00120BB1AC|nr:AlpA family phage regulatory protein [Pseudomonas sp.]RZI75181.1 MAG: AlpA family phage regulatory protein [Pseudomonas sp.]
MAQIQVPSQQSDEELLRIDDVLSRVPVCRATWWNGVKTGRFPAGVKLGPKMVFWRASDIDALIRSL